jgi:hypothetical protein
MDLVRPEGLGKLINFNYLIGSRTRDLPACSIVQPLGCRVPPHVGQYLVHYTNDGECGAVGGMSGKGKPSTRRQHAAVPLSNTDPAWLDPGSNPGRRVGKPTNNLLSYGKAQANS